tara:strand:+ start:23 stop:295 length:273 start_codon:yes stop_codon:yes gene_type:complete
MLIDKIDSPLSLYCLSNLSKKTISFLHGEHQVAQKLIKTGPFVRYSPNVTVLPFIFVNLRFGETFWDIKNGIKRKVIKKNFFIILYFELE